MQQQQNCYNCFNWFYHKGISYNGSQDLIEYLAWQAFQCNKNEKKFNFLCSETQQKRKRKSRDNFHVDRGGRYNLQTSSPQMLLLRDSKDWEGVSGELELVTGDLNKQNFHQKFSFLTFNGDVRSSAAAVSVECSGREKTSNCVFNKTKGLQVAK